MIWLLAGFSKSSIIKKAVARFVTANLASGLAFIAVAVE
jgi:hypothetical protein